LVFKTDSQYIEHFYRDLEPWTHYIPVEANLKDLVKKIKWAESKEDEAKHVAEEGMKYARENLMPLDIFCYYGTIYKVLRSNSLKLEILLYIIDHNILINLPQFISRNGHAVSRSP